jgi:hypothetical protein
MHPANIPDIKGFRRLVAQGQLGPSVAITCRGRTDGAGSQSMAVICAMAVARLAGCQYQHTAFVSMAHDGGSREDWARRWEAFLNLGDGEAPVPQSAELVPLSAAVANAAAYAGRPIVVFGGWFSQPREIRPILESLRAALRAKYWRSPKDAIPSHRAPSGLTAAIHLRRGDVSASRNARRFVGDDLVLRQIERLRQAVAPLGRTLTINLYSEGRAEDFRAFADAGCNLHVSEDAFEAFHNMVTADILMIAPSTFSRVAALLSRGIVLDRQPVSPPFSGWLRRRADGDISIKRLRRSLLDRMGWLEWVGYRARLLGTRRRT